MLSKVMVTERVHIIYTSNKNTTLCTVFSELLILLQPN